MNGRKAYDIALVPRCQSPIRPFRCPCLCVFCCKPHAWQSRHRPDLSPAIQQIPRYSTKVLPIQRVLTGTWRTDAGLTAPAGNAQAGAGSSQLQPAQRLPATWAWWAARALATQQRMLSGRAAALRGPLQRLTQQVGLLTRYSIESLSVILYGNLSQIQNGCRGPLDG